ncbi:MAG TPA: zf-HC2 domain-containing protein, partial [Chthonomonadales bacterium]|nr:zf-HC2 domain-containing protein [Chthonomonadales bacterium]
MDCKLVWDLLSRYNDGEATSEEAAIVEAHVSVCASCARDLAFLRNMSAALAAIPRVEPPPALQNTILAATIYRPTRWEQVARAARHLFRPLPVRYGMVAAAGTAVALTLAVMRHPQDLFLPPTPHIALRPPVVA